MEGYLLFATVLVIVACRVAPSYVWPTLTSDAGFHMLMRREIRKNAFRVPTRLRACVFDERVTYPWLYHQLIALFPETWLRRVPALPSALIDALHSCLAFFIGWWLAGTLGYPDAAPWAGLWSALLFGLNPALLAHGMGPRAYEVTPRPFGEFLFSLSLWSAIWALSGGHWAGWVVSILAGGGMLLASKFAAQVFLFFVPIVALLSGSPRLLLVLPLALVAAMVLSAGRYGDILKGQWVHLNHYRCRMQYTFRIVADRNRMTDVRRVWDAIRSSGLFSRETVSAAGYLYTTNTYLLALSRGSVFFLAAFVFLGWLPARVSIAPGAPADFMWAWYFVWLAPFIFTSTKHFRFLGEAERYMEYAVLPASVLLGVILAVGSPNVWFGFLVAVHVLLTMVLVAHAWIIHRKHFQRSGRELDDIGAFLGSLPDQSAIIEVPVESLLRPIYSQLNHRFVAFADAIRWIEQIDTLFEGDYPWPKPDWEFWRQQGIDYIITVSPQELAAARPSLTYDFTGLKCVYSDNRYFVYSLSS